MRLRLLTATATVAAAATVATVAGCGMPVRTPGTESVDQMRVVSHLAKVPGYDRSCSQGRACVFGPAWTDAVSTRRGGDGCDQRSNLLAEQLVDIRFKPGTRRCVVATGTLNDPYSGNTVTYRRGQQPVQVSVDHVLPLAGAWDRGAAGWPQDRRADFAGDLDNMLATTAAENSSKRDRGPGDWSPETSSGRCVYARRFVGTAVRYDLAVTRIEVSALRDMLAGC